ncbi:MAG: hypothetical protein RJB13_1161 [Pseudomonadota bacterium]
MNLWIAIAVVAVAVLYLISNYNALIEKRNRFRNAFSQIDVQLERRYDLIPNLVETARAYMAHERDTLEAVISARNQAQAACRKAAGSQGSPESIAQLAQAEGLLSQSLGKFFALAESYPDLKAQSTMSQLMEEMTSTENKVSFARQAYNDSVMHYNSAREKFPEMLYAGAFGFSEAAFLKLDTDEKRAAPKVQFS